MKLISHILPASVCFAVLACSAAEVPPDKFGYKGTGIAVAVAPLDLKGVSDACYSFEVKNGLGQRVVARGSVQDSGGGGVAGQGGDGGPTSLTGREALPLCASRFGNGGPSGGGAINYVAPCDATPGATNHSVTLWVNAVCQSGSLINESGQLDQTGCVPMVGYQNPCGNAGCVVSATCVEDSDVPVRFDLTIMAAAKQGFFDIAVRFDEVFCSAKLDSCYANDEPIRLLFDDAGNEVRTAVAAIACTAGTESITTHLYETVFRVTCDGTTYTLDLDGRDVEGNTELTSTTGASLNASVFFGTEALVNGGAGSQVSANKVFTNIAFELPAVGCDVDWLIVPTDDNTTCPSSLDGSSGTFRQVAGVKFDGVVAGGDDCSRHPLDAPSSAVHTAYLDHSGTAAYTALLSEGAQSFVPAACVDVGPCPNGGALSPCGNCDPECREVEIGTVPGGTPTPFDPTTTIGVVYDPNGPGLVIDRSGVTANFLWIPNTNESSVSKWDVGSNPREVGRYRVGLVAGECANQCCWSSGCNQPSRIVVDGRGDAYVANRGFDMQGSVTKIAGDITRCVDRNNNGTIDTSPDATKLAWAADECVLWTANVGTANAILRAIAIDRGDAGHPEGYPWVGGFNTQAFYRLDPDTGATLSTVSSLGMSPYGAVVTADGKLWASGLSSYALISIDTTTAPYAKGALVSYPESSRSCADGNHAYGIAADGSGRIWLAGWSCKDIIAYSPSQLAWSRINLSAHNQWVGRGITVRTAPDGTEQIWALMGADGQAYFTNFPSSTFSAGSLNISGSAFTVTSLPAGHSGPSGTGLDAAGNVWIANHVTSQLVRYAPSTNTFTSFTGPNRPYTYSDFTGSVRRQALNQGTYLHTATALCPSPTWGTLRWAGTVAAGTSIEFVVRTGTSTLTVGSSTPVTVVGNPADLGAAFQAANIPQQSTLAVTATLRSLTGINTPLLSGFEVQWACPAPAP